MKWCKDFLNSTDNTEISYEKMIQMAQEIPIGSEGLMFFPYLMGERRSENINTPGCVFGLRLKHKLAHLARAVMEGTALALGKDIQYFRSMGVPLNKVFCVGGATRNRLLYQMKADIMQLPMILTDEPESSLKGCAILARYGLGDFKEKQLLISKISNNQQVISPNLDVAVKYHDLLQEFIRFYDHLLGFWA